ncbi:FUSC family protein [Cellulomonas sp. McL0617]|uniref:FUSC family protein n=1 Tax=Cellulomonas sp. McL0617 TaxID=3415675 RepID=UPI003CF02F4D
MSAEAAAGARTRVLLETRFRQGLSRVHAGWFPILQAAIAAGIAFGLARYVANHPYPFFAPVCAWVALGFTADRSVRRVAELAVGVAIGVALGDVLVRLIGNGIWQVAVVLFLAATIARFIDRGVLLTTQAGVQALVIVGLPALTASGGPLGRWIDAAIGGAVALVVALLTPRDPRRRSRALARTACDELAGVLRLFGRGLLTGSSDDVEDALVRARASQPAFDEWSETAKNAGELARISPTIRRFRDELAALEGRAVLVDRAMRNTRVLVRRSLAAVEAGTHDLSAVGAHVDATARAAAELAAALGSGREPARARSELLAIAQALDPYALDDWQVQSLVLLQRSLVVDLLEAAGTERQAARDALPEI